MAVVTIELEMEIDKDLGVITLPEVINYLENLLEIMRMQLNIKEKMGACQLKLEEVVELCFIKEEL